MEKITWDQEMLYVGRNRAGIIVRVQEEKPNGYVEKERNEIFERKEKMGELT